MADPLAELDVDRMVFHAERPGFRITELRMTPTQQVPWHRHSNIEDTFYVLDGRLRISLREPDDQVDLEPGQSFGPVSAGRPHLVTNRGDTPVTFFVLQGVGAYDYVPLA